MVCGLLPQAVAHTVCVVAGLTVPCCGSAPLWQNSSGDRMPLQKGFSVLPDVSLSELSVPRRFLPKIYQQIRQLEQTGVRADL